MSFYVLFKPRDRIVYKKVINFVWLQKVGNDYNNALLKMKFYIAYVYTCRWHPSLKLSINHTTTVYVFHFSLIWSFFSKYCFSHFCFYFVLLLHSRLCTLPVSYTHLVAETFNTNYNNTPRSNSPESFNNDDTGRESLRDLEYLIVSSN